ncbi:hypothetical protein ONZ51_g6511 [Trametes cubensis]|uniref:Heme oxygenase n=1 Tax=Trametes cubensis TaxID=1111947 RepID=A0AAD7TT29_9APHY|nr:hypothetical protein ONZ51_g6511 [Trametes cubensis]
MPAVVDLSQPAANILRQGTAEAHERAEHSQGAKWLARGELDKEEYVRFLMMLWHIYDTPHIPSSRPTHNPGLFARSANIAADISYLLNVPEDSWQTHPLHVALTSSPPPALTQYVERIRELAASPDPSRLLAHAYVRYLGDLSGGQFIRRRIMKAYGLEDGAGVSFYEFRPLGGGASSSSTASTMGDLKKIKEWYRDGMNAGVGDNTELKAAILEEARLAFDYNTALFDALNPPSTTSSSGSDIEIDSPLHSPVESSPPSPPATDVSHSPLGVAVKTQEDPKVVYEASQPPTEERFVSLSSVIALVAALSITHLVLVVGGFTGERGFAKLENFQQWLAGVFGPTAA